MLYLYRAGLALALVAASGAQAQSERLDDGRNAYQTTCATCHESGIKGAPQSQKPEDWKDRSHLWEAVLTEHARKGYINMPAAGGASHLTDYDVGAAAEYMLTITHPELPAD